MGLFAKGRTFLQTTMEAEGVDIVYVRDTAQLPFKATPDSPEEFGLQTFGDGQTVVINTRAWAFDWSELDALTPAEPRDGDKIRLVVRNTIHQWTVRPDSQGKCFEELDGGRSRISANTVYDGVV